jgi:hypothetical protein
LNDSLITIREKVEQFVIDEKVGMIEQLEEKLTAVVSPSGILAPPASA